jgi:uncharacterized protein (TIGR00369 family)
MNETLTIDAPPGFKKLPMMGFVEVNGPLWGKLEGDRPFLAFRVEKRHLNPRKICHGGMLMTFADMVLGFAANAALGGRKFMPTVNMTVDFVAPGNLGDWVVGAGRLVRATRNLAFCDADLTVGETIVLRANGIMKVPADDAHHNLFDLFQ